MVIDYAVKAFQVTDMLQQKNVKGEKKKKRRSPH